MYDVLLYANSLNVAYFFGIYPLHVTKETCYSKIDSIITLSVSISYCKTVCPDMTLFKFNLILKLFIICDYLYQSGYYSYLIKVGLGMGEDNKGSFTLFNLCCKVAKVCEKLFYKKNYKSVYL